MRHKIRTRQALKVGIACLLLLLSSHKLVQTWVHMRDQARTNDPSARKRPRVIANMPPGGMDDLYRRLRLTEDQRPRIETIVTSARDRMGLIHNDAALSQQEKKAKLKALMQETVREMHSVLRPDQQQELDQLHKMQTH